MNHLPLRFLIGLIAGLIGMAAPSSAQSFTGTYTFGSDGNVASFAYNGTAISNLTPSSIDKVGITTSSSSNNFRATQWPLGATDGSNVFSGSVDTGKFIEFTLTASEGFAINFPTITFGVGRSAAGPRQWQWRSSVDNYAAAIPVTTVSAGLSHSGGVLTNPDSNSSWTGNVIQTAGNDYQSLTTITFRLYGYNAETTAGTGGLQGALTFGGTLVATGESTPPSLGPVVVSNVTFSSASLSATFVANNGEDFTTYGFVLSPTSASALPSVGDEGVIDVAFDHANTAIASPISATATGLEPSTQYAVRAYVIYDSGDEIIYSPEVGTFTTGPLPPSLTSEAPYAQGFEGFTSSETLPSGWSVTAGSLVFSEWANTTTGIKFSSASANVLGYQHAGTTGVATKTLTLLNETGGEITELYLSYIGRVARVTEGRNPSLTVVVAGQTVSALAYSTAAGVDQQRTALVTGLSIPAGSSFTIAWSSDGSEAGSPGSGNRRQIGISEVVVSSQALELDPPVISLAAGTYFEDQTVLVSNFGDYPEGTEVRYTLNGTMPSASNGLIYDETGILIQDGNGPVTLRVVAIDPDSGLISPTAATSYIFPINVADLATLRAQPTGTPIYRVTSTMVLTGQTSFRSTKFFQDASGAGIQIDDNAPLIQTIYQEGDAIEALVGRINLFQGQLQLVPLQDPGAAVSSDNVVQPVVRTLASLGFNDQALLVTIEDVEFTAADGAAVFGAGGSETPITDGTGSGLHRHTFSDTDLAAAVLPSGSGSITGIIMQRTTGITIGARSLSDLDFAEPPPPPAEDNFGSWIAGFNVAGQNGPRDTPAGDGVPNILKHVLGLAPDVAVTGSLIESTAGGAGAITFVHTRIKPASLASDVIADYEWSMNLADWAGDGGSMAGVTVEFAEAVILDASDEVFDVVSVTANVTEGTAGKLFVRIMAGVDVMEE